MKSALAPSALVAPPSLPKVPKLPKLPQAPQLQSLQSPQSPDAAGGRPAASPSAPASLPPPFAQMLRRQQSAEPAPRPTVSEPASRFDGGDRAADPASGEKNIDKSTANEPAAVRRARLGGAKPAAPTPGGAERTAKSTPGERAGKADTVDEGEGADDADAAGDSAAAAAASAAALGHASPTATPDSAALLAPDGPHRAALRPDADDAAVDDADDAGRSTHVPKRGDAASRFAAGADGDKTTLASDPSASSASPAASDDASAASNAAGSAAALAGSETARAAPVDAAASRLEAGALAAAAGVGTSGMASGPDPASMLASTPAGSETAHVPAPVDSPEFARAFGVEVSVLARHGVQRAELRMNPADMGPVSVQIVLDGTQARVDFGADVAATRTAIEAGLPDLAAALREAGLTLAGGGVSAHAGGGGHGAADGGGQRLPGDGRTNGDGASRPDANDTGAAPRLRRTVAAGGVDLYA